MEVMVPVIVPAAAVAIVTVGNPEHALDALGVTGLRQRQQREQYGGGCEQQPEGQTDRQGCGGDTSFVHLQSQGK
jgi:hypothetical protein